MAVSDDNKCFYLSFSEKMYKLEAKEGNIISLF
jgi:hypothetical protein